MKIDQKANTLVESNVAGSSQEFVIGDVGVIIEIFRNKFYANPIQTLVQEYICNGRDALREFKAENPAKMLLLEKELKGLADSKASAKEVEEKRLQLQTEIQRRKKQMESRVVVQLPTEIDPTFKIRDYGVGLSPQRIAEVFTAYGKSTKRTSNEQTGGFGLGAKSAWSYTEMFTVVAHYEGRCRTYVADIGAKVNGLFTKIDDQPTNELNGTEVIIGIKPSDVYKFRNAAFRCCAFWNHEERPVFKGITKEEMPDWYEKEVVKPEWSGQGWKMYAKDNFKDFFSSEDVVAVDGIGYLITGNLKFVESYHKLRNLVDKNFRIVLEVGNGSGISIAATRESISDSKETQDKLNKIFKDVLSEIESRSQKEAKESKNIFELQNVFLKYNEMWDKPRAVVFKTKSNKTVQITEKGLLEMGMLNSARLETYMMKSQSSGRQVLTREHSNHMSSLKQEHGINRYVYVDNFDIAKKEEISEFKMRERIRFHLKQKENYTIYCLYPDTFRGTLTEFKELVKELDAIPVSQLPEPPPEVRMQTIRASRKGKITFYRLSTYSRSWKESVTVDFADLQITDKTILFEMVEGNRPEELSREQSLLNYLTRYGGYKLIGFSPMALKKVRKEHEDFFKAKSIAEIRKNILELVPIPKEYFESHRYQDWKSLSSELVTLKKILPRIKDKRVHALIAFNEKASKQRVSSNVSLPEEIKKLVEHKLPEIKEETKIMVEMGAEVSKQYAIVRYVKDDFVNHPELLEMIVNHCNAPFEEKKKVSKKSAAKS